METRDIFEQMAARYDTADRVAIAKRIAEEMKTELKDEKGKTAMDYGCGTGLVGLELAHLFNTMIFVDTAAQMVAQVQAKADALGFNHIQTHVGDFTEDSLFHTKVDCILLSQVLLHVKEEGLLLKRLFALLNPGGQLLIVDFDENNKVNSPLVHSGFNQKNLMARLKEIGFTKAYSRNFFEGKEIFMKQDATLFILKAQK